MSRTRLIAKLKAGAVRLSKHTHNAVVETWNQATLAVALRDTFKQGSAERKAFLATAATAAVKNEGTIDLWCRAVDMRNNLSKANRSKVESDGYLWPVDSINVLRGATPAQVTRIIDKAVKAGTTNTKDIRAFKSQVVGKSTRNTPDETERTFKLAKSIESDVVKLVKSGHSYASLAAGAELAMQHGGQNVSGAIIFLAAQVKPAGKVVKS